MTVLYWILIGRDLHLSKDKEGRDKQKRNKIIRILMVALVIPLSIIGLIAEVGGGGHSQLDTEGMGDVLAIVPMIIVIVAVLVVIYILKVEMKV